MSWLSLGEPTCRACGATLPDDVRTGPTLRALALLLLSLLLLPPLTAVFLLEEHAREAWPSVEAEVVGGALESRGDARLARLTVRFQRDGAERSLAVYRTAPPQAVTRSFEVDRERAFLDRFPRGTRVPVWFDPAQPETALLDLHPHSFSLAGLLLLAWMGVAGLDTLAGGLWARMRHTACDLDPGRSRAWFDHRPGVGTSRWLGPSVACSTMLFGLGSVGAALWAGRATPPWLALLVAACAVLLVGLLRYLVELRGWLRWRKAELWLEPPRAFAPGGTYVAALLDRPNRAPHVTLELREEEGWSDHVWRGQVVATGQASAQPAPEGARVELTLPADAAPPAREEGYKRRRWVVRARSLGAEALFELDFTPAAPPPPADPAEIAQPEAREWLEETRRTAGPAPREPLDYRKAYPPPWMDDDDLLHEVLREQQTLLRHGQVVWGATVQANRSLFEPGAEDSAASALYSLDPELDLGVLTDMARRLFETKDEPIDRLSQHIADESETLLRVPAPDWLTGGARDVFLATLLVPRHHLPDGRLRARSYPLLVAPERTRAAMLLPAAYWGPLLRQRWRELAAAEREDDEPASEG